jgi:hypothetical protein
VRLIWERVLRYAGAEAVTKRGGGAADEQAARSGRLEAEHDAEDERREV